MEFWILLSFKKKKQKNVLTIFLKNFLCLILYLKKQGDILNQLGLGQL